MQKKSDQVIVRHARLVTFLCQQCGEEVTEQRYPSHIPLYCSKPECKKEATKVKTRQRVAAWRIRQTKKPIPLTLLFPENTRGYSLSVSRPGRMSIEASSGESCLQAMKSSADGEVITIVGYHKDQIIGHGEYRRRGRPGSLESIETLSADGMLVGLVEIALARRAEEQQKQLQAERSERLVQLFCFCGQPLGYDQMDHCFALPTGRGITSCPTCGMLLDLEQIKQQYQQRIAALEDELKRQQEALRRVQRIRDMSHPEV